MIWWTPIVVVGVMLLKRDSLCRGLRFELKETNLIAKEGDCVQISCTGYNIISDEYTWFWYKNANFNVTSKNYNGTVLYTNHRERKAHRDFEGRVTALKEPTSTYEWEVQICCLRMNDSGGYSFRYEGSDKYFSEAKLQVHENPCKVRFQTSTIHLKESDEAVFTCSTSSSCGRRPLIGGLPMHAQLDERNNTSIVARLRLNWTDHQIQLSCDVPGAISECLRQNITLTVQYTPRKPVLNGTRKKVPLGESLTLTCSAEANPAPTYTWFLPWKNETTHSAPWLNQNPNNRLEIQRVARAHNGCYHCSASNLLGRGENSSSYCVEVLFAPTLPVLSVVQFATEGDVITINCSVESWPLPSSLNLSWSSARDPSMHQLLHSVSNAASLTQMLNVTHASAGHYTCRALNSQGSNQLQKVLTVYYAPQNLSVKVNWSLELTEGMSLGLFCEAQSLPPVSNYSWTRTRTSAGQEEVIGSDQKLDLVSVTSADHGWYRCGAQNQVGISVSQEVRVTVSYAPKDVTITGLSGDEYDAGVPIQLSCHSTSFPPVNLYKWYKKRNNISKVEPVESGQNLTVHPDHPGIYHCYASNDKGGTDSNPVRLFLKTRCLTEILWIVPFVCILVLVVIIYLFCRHKRKKLVSDGSPDPLSRPVTPITEARGSRDDLLPNQGRSHTCHALAQAAQSSAAGAERLSTNDSTVLYSTVKLPTRMQIGNSEVPIRGDHSYAGDEVNYASLHFPTLGPSQGCPPPAAMENDVYAKIANKNEENEGDNQMVDIELNYSQVTFMAKKSKTRKTKKTTR